MTASEFIDQVLAEIDQVAPSDADYSTLRSERLNDLREVAGDFWDSHDFSWQYIFENLTIASGDTSCVLPERFQNFGDYGQVFLTATGEPMEYVSPRSMQATQQDPAASTSSPCEYSLYGFSVPESETAGREMIQVPRASGDVVLTIYYKQTLSEYSDNNPSEPDGLSDIPIRHQRQVLWAGVRAKAKHSVGDARYSEFRSDPAYVAAKKAAIQADKKGKEQVYQLPSVFGGN
jgi:hypothetical protein